MSAARQLALLDGDLRAGDLGEFVPTPPWFVLALCRSAGLWPWDRRVLDAGAGLGAIGAEIHRWAETARPGHPPLLTAVELFPNRAAQLTAPVWQDVHCAELGEWAAVAAEQGATWPLIVTNPPFKIWRAWVTALLPLLSAGGRLFCLLPWEYVSRHHPFWAASPAATVYRCARRPWKNEVREVCWVEWRQGWTGPTLLAWLDHVR